MSIYRLTKPAIAGVLSALAMAPAAFAGQPPRGDLNPPPPDFYSCSASGDQTICRAHRFEREDPVQTDVQCPGFPIYDQGDVEERLTRWYDADGNFVKRQLRGTWTNAMWSNPLTGDTVPYTANGVVTDVLGTPGDVDTITETERGENVYTDPVTHKKVLRSAGRTVFGPDGTLLAESGQQWAIDLFVFGDQSVLDGVCAALAR